VTDLVTTIETVAQNPIETDPTVVWESDFSEGTLDGFLEANLENFCTNSSASRSDVLAHNVTDASEPSGRGRALELVANVDMRRGVFVNAMTGRDAPFFVDNSRWYVYGYFKRMPSKIQNNAINLQLVENSEEHICLVQWILNPEDRDYGWVKVRTQRGDTRIHRIGDDEGWHYFELEGVYASDPRTRRIARVMIDKTSHRLDEEMPTVPKEWASSFMVLLENTNMYKDPCTENVNRAVMRWARVGLVRRSIS
jgi:hypothetical protein